MGIARFSRSKSVWYTHVISIRYARRWRSTCITAEHLNLSQQISRESRTSSSFALFSAHSEYGQSENRFIATCFSPKHHDQVTGKKTLFLSENILISLADVTAHPLEPTCIDPHARRSVCALLFSPSVRPTRQPCPDRGAATGCCPAALTCSSKSRQYMGPDKSADLISVQDLAESMQDLIWHFKLHVCV